MLQNKFPLKSRFKKFGGEFIPDIIEYLKDQIERDPYITISLGCDSVQRHRKTLFAVTLMIYNTDIKNGAHVVFFRDNQIKIRDNQERLQKEALIVHQIAEYLNEELSKFYVRKDLTEISRKQYKYHLQRCLGKFDFVKLNDEENVIKNLTLTDGERGIVFNSIDLHLDFNPDEGKVDNRGGYSINKSNQTYKSFVPWLRSIGYRVWVKPLAHASTSAADLLLQ
jgi:predicted RNase H-related nuclease YkuK (DUF458 family)